MMRAHGQWYYTVRRRRRREVFGGARKRRTRRSRIPRYIPQVRSPPFCTSLYEICVFFSSSGTVSWTACDCIIIIQYTATAIYLIRGRADEFFSTFSNFFRCWQVELARGEEVIILFRRGRKKNGFSKARANVTCREPKNIWRRSNGSTCAGGGWLHTYIIIYGTHVHTYPPNSEH